MCRPGCALALAATCARLHFEARRIDSSGLTAVAHLFNGSIRVHTLLAGGCYSTRAAGSGVCREASDGACVGYKEAVTDRTKEQVEVREGSTGCTANGDNNCQTCDVTIGGKMYCSQCKTGFVPIDGTCTQVGDATSGKCLKAGGQPLTDDTQCGQCGPGYFLHKGGCYQRDGSPGSIICKTAGSNNGICEACQAGYFKND